MRGSLDRFQQKILADIVTGQVVHDLGAGDLFLAHYLVHYLGASKVIAVEKERVPPPTSDKVEYVRSYFDKFEGKPDVALLSWPVSWDSGVLHLVRKARILIYLGRNTDGTVCGYRNLWGHLASREVLHYDDRSDQHNTLIIYGPGPRVGRRLPEEHAALDQSRVWTPMELKEWERAGNRS